jgi:hypothetical protein
MKDLLEYRALSEGSGNSAFAELATRRVVCAIALALVPVALWCLTHRYLGLIGDSGLYALQALSRSDPGLGRDVFLSNNSQDRYTIFSPIYAFFIKEFGLRTAAIALLVIFKLCFYGAAWACIRKLFDARTTLLTMALLIVVPIEYGAYHVFRVAEDMLTARSMAEALAMAGLCLYVYGRKSTGLVLAACGLCVHALIALPPVLFLLSMRFGARRSFLCAVAAVAAVACAAWAAAIAPHWTPAFLPIMDPIWLDMVRERSQFVFPRLWSLADWESTARPFVSLSLSLVVFRNENIRRLCASAMIVGAAGLAIACVADLIAPVAILLQAQTWRWVWITGLWSLLLVAPTVFEMWRCERCGPLCGVLLLLGWLISVLDGVYFVAAALCLWHGRKHIPAAAAPYLRWAATCIGLLVLARIVGTGWTVFSLPAAGSTADVKIVTSTRSILALDCLPVIIAFLLGCAVMRSRTLVFPAALALVLGTATAFAAPSALRDTNVEGGIAQREEFSDWRDAIPAGDNVLVVPRYYTAGFTWFTLGRPSYLSVDQSSGIIFSRATAMEVRRRSQVLLAIEEPGWRLLSHRETHNSKFDASARPLTRESLVQICADPELNFVVAREDVGFGPLHHRHAGVWNGYNLYDCSRVNASKDGA